MVNSIVHFVFLYTALECIPAIDNIESNMTREIILFINQNDANSKFAYIFSSELNTLRQRQYGCNFADIFLNENVRFWIKISLKFVP